MTEQVPPKRQRRIVNERAWLKKLVYSGQDYQAHERGFVYWKDSIIPEPLCDFTARIVEDLVLDDGVETIRAYRIEAVLNQGKRRHSITVSARDFAALSWVDQQLGADASIYPNCKPHVATAIKRLSGQKVKRTVFQHTGWRTINGKAVFLHAGGGIGARGSVKGIDTQLDPALRNYLLPEPPQGEQLATAVRASLKMLDLYPDRITFPMHSAIWRAKLGECDFTLFPSGRTQSGKTVLTALAQQHDGAAWSRKKLPASFLGTPGSIELQAFCAKDNLFTIDDFKPSGSAVDRQRMHALAERLFRGMGNQSTRSRLTADITLRPSKPPRCLYLSSGEEVPQGHSLRARLIVIEMAPGDLRSKALLTECQRDARNGLYAEAMAGFVRWLAPRIEESGKMLEAEIDALRQASDDGSNVLLRSPDNVYQLAAGFKVFLSFAVQMRAIDKTKAEQLWNRATAAYAELIGAQERQQEASDPARQFFELLAGIFQSGDAHIAATSGAPPESPIEWGWVQSRDGQWIPSGPRLGWIDTDGLYLKPRPTYNALRHFALRAGENLLPPADTMWLRLQQAKLLDSTGEKSRGTKFTIRHYCEGGRPDVLYIHRSSLLLMTDQTDPSDPKRSIWEGFRSVLRHRDRPTDPPLTQETSTQTIEQTGPGQMGQFGQSLERKTKARKRERVVASQNGNKPGHATDPSLTQTGQETDPWQGAGFESAQAFEQWYEAIYANHPTRGGLKAGRADLAELVAEGTFQRQAFDNGYQSWRSSAAWTRDGGRFIPKLSTFIQDRGWDFPPVEPTAAESNGAKPEHRPATPTHSPTAAERRAERLRNI
jgi:hypothetical protein